MKPWEAYQQEESGPWSEYQAATPKKADEPSKLRRFGQGQMDTAVGAGQVAVRGYLGNPLFDFADKIAGSPIRRLLSGATKDYAAKTAEYEAGREGADGIDWMRVAGAATSPYNVIAGAAGTPTGTTLGALARAGGLSGAVSGGMQPVMPGQDFALTKAGQTLLGGASGALLGPVVGKTLSAVGRMVPGGTTAKTTVSPEEVERAVDSALRSQGIAPDAVAEAGRNFMRKRVQAALAAGVPLDDPATLARMADAESLGIQLTQGQATRNPMQWARERDLRGISGVGEKLTQRLQDQRAALDAPLMPAVDRPVDQVGDVVINAATSADKARQEAIRAAYLAARNKAGKDATVPLTGLADDYGKLLEDFGEANIPSAIRSKVAEYGIVGGKQTKLFTPLEADNLLKQINKLYDPSKKAEAAALDELRRSVKRAMTDGPVDDVFAPARALAKERFDTLDKTPALKAIVEGKVAPDDFVRRFILGGKRDDVKSLANALDGNDEAKGAVRDAIVAHLRKAAFGVNPAGDSSFTPTRFQGALEGLGKNKLAAFFTPEEIAQFYTIGRVGGAINSVPNASAPNFSNTAASNANRVFDMLSGLGRIPGVKVPLVYDYARNTAGGLAAGQALQPIRDPVPALSPELQRLLGLSVGAAGVGGGVFAAQ